MSAVFDQREGFHCFAAIESSLISNGHRMSSDRRGRSLLFARALQTASPRVTQSIAKSLKRCSRLIERRLIAPFIGRFLIKLLVTSSVDVFDCRIECSLRAGGNATATNAGNAGTKQNCRAKRRAAYKTIAALPPHSAVRLCLTVASRFEIQKASPPLVEA